MGYCWATVEYLVGLFWVALGSLRCISVLCMGDPWEAPGLKHLAAIVVSLCRQFSLAWAAMFRCLGDSRCRFLIT